MGVIILPYEVDTMQLKHSISLKNSELRSHLEIGSNSREDRAAIGILRMDARFIIEKWWHTPFLSISELTV
jgi:hypothetical protein